MWSSASIASYTDTTCGWFSAAEERASRRARARSGADSPGSTPTCLTATSRPSSSSRHSHTVPMPPRPTARITTYRPAMISGATPCRTRARRRVSPRSDQVPWSDDVLRDDRCGSGREALEVFVGVVDPHVDPHRQVVGHLEGAPVGLVVGRLAGLGAGLPLRAGLVGL